LWVPVLLEIGRESVRDEAGDDRLLAEAELVAEAMAEAPPPPCQGRLFD
jgi:ATP-dependent helicase Lhr and Lhr-like helicase